MRVWEQFSLDVTVPTDTKGVKIRHRRRSLKMSDKRSASEKIDLSQNSELKTLYY